MAGHDAPMPLAQALCDVAVGRAVVAHAQDAVLLCPLVRDGEHPSLHGNGLVEGRLEHAHLPHLRQQALKHRNRLQIRPVVCGCDGVEGAHALKNILRQEVHAVVVLGEHGLVAHGRDFLQAGKYAQFAARQCVQEQLDSGGVVRHRKVFPVNFSGGRGIGEDRILRTHALNAPLRQNRVFRHLPQLELQGCAAGVANQYLHGTSRKDFCCTYVSAFNISILSVAPRFVNIHFGFDAVLISEAYIIRRNAPAQFGKRFFHRSAQND